MPYLRVRAIASASDSITEAIRKLPLSFTTLAISGLSPMTKTRWPRASSSGRQSLHDGLFAGCGDEQLAGGRGVRTSEHGSGDIVMSAPVMFLGQSAGQRHADGAHGNMGRAPGQSLNHAIRQQDRRFDSRIVGQHGYDDFGVLGRFRRRLGDLGAFRAQRLGFGQGAIPDGDVRARRESDAAPWVFPYCLSQEMRFSSCSSRRNCQPVMDV